ncbi:MAG: FkbM family methyltransferase [Nitrososphaerales archaeon]|nr:FkbM family methyltransferase [Nitrososphaerales archaeon]
MRNVTISIKGISIREIDLPSLTFAYLGKKISGGPMTNYLPRPVTVQADGFKWTWRPRTEDAYGFAETEPFMISQLNGLLPDGGTFVDVGANIGKYSIRLSRRASTVWALEPNPKNFCGLVTNIHLNGIQNIIALPIAAWSSRTVLYVSDEGTRSSVLTSGAHRTLGVRLDEICDFEPDLVKMDVQGAELEGLKGMEKTNAKRIVVEIHTSLVSVEAVLSMMKERGYRPEEIASGETHRYFVFSLG